MSDDTTTQETEANAVPGADSVSGEDLTFENVSSILSYDPFSNENETTGTEGEPAPEAAQAQEGEATSGTDAMPGNAESSEDETSTTTEAEQQAEPPELTLLRQQLETQRALIEQLQRQGQGSGQAPAQGQLGTEPSAGTEPPAVPEYQFTIPDQLMSLLDSEDPAERRQGLGALAQGLAQTVHQQMLDQVQGMMQQVVPATVTNIVAQQNTAKAVFDDFYGAHADLNRQELRPLIVQVAQTVMQETGAQEWSPQLRDTIAQRVKGILGQAPQGQPTPAAPPAQPSGNRKSRGNNAENAAPSLVDEVSSTLFG